MLNRQQPRRGNDMQSSEMVRNLLGLNYKSAWKKPNKIFELYSGIELLPSDSNKIALTNSCPHKSFCVQCGVTSASGWLHPLIRHCGV